MKGRFLFAAWPFPGHLFPQIAVARAIARLGHECAFYTGRESAELVRAEGFACFPFSHVDEDAIGRLMRERPSEPWRLANISRLGLLLRRWLLDTIPDQIRDLEEILASWQPTVIACDPTLWAPILVVGEKHRVQVAVCSFIPACPLPGPDAPPFGPGLARTGNWRHALLLRLLRASTKVSARAARRAANAIRTDHGLAPIAVSVTEYSGQMPLYLVPCTRAFDYERRDLPASIHYVGPYLWNRPHAEIVPRWLAELPSDIPCVHVTEGTMHVHAPIVLRAALEGLANLPIRVVMTTGKDRTLDAGDLANLADNIQVEAWVSHSDLLPKTDVMVTTGGAGSVLAALAAGVPLVLVPTEWDKQEIAQRVVEAGAGVRLAPRQCTPGRLRDAVQAVLADPSFRTNAQRLASSFASAGGPDLAAELLVALVRSSSDVDRAH
jgi:MGT family glycosyltransferase